MTSSSLGSHFSNEYQSIEDARLKKFFVFSFIFHLALIIYFSISPFSKTLQVIELDSALRVDLVDLPDKLTKPSIQPAPAKKAEPAATDTPFRKTEAPPQEKPKEEVTQKEKPADTNEINLDANKAKKAPEKKDKLNSKQQAALSKLQQDNALSRIAEDVEEDSKIKPQAKPTYKGNKITSGTELQGLSRLQHDQYVGAIERAIRAQWSLPEWLARKKLRAQVRVRVSTNGSILGVDFVKMSGNPTFDENVMTTVYKSAPLPPPPERLEILLKNEGIILGFPD